MFKNSWISRFNLVGKLLCLYEKNSYNIFETNVSFTCFNRLVAKKKLVSSHGEGSVCLSLSCWSLRSEVCPLCPYTVCFLARVGFSTTWSGRVFSHPLSSTEARRRFLYNHAEILPSPVYVCHSTSLKC